MRLDNSLYTYTHSWNQIVFDNNFINDPRDTHKINMLKAVSKNV